MERLLNAHQFVKRCEDLHLKHFWLLPVCKYTHWSLVIMCYAGSVFKKVAPTRILIMDSLRGPRSKEKYNVLVKRIAEFIGFEINIRSRLGAESTDREIKKTHNACSLVAENLEVPFHFVNVPAQTNGYDCGLCLLANAEYFMENPERVL